MTCLTVLGVVVGALGLFLLAVFWRDLFQTPEKKLERQIYERRKLARDKDIAERAEDIVRHLGSNGSYEEGELLIKEAASRYDMGATEHELVIYWNGGLVFEVHEGYYEPDEKRPQGYDFGSKEIKAYIPGPWEQTFERAAHRAALVIESKKEQWKREREEEQRKNFGLQ